VTRLGVYFPIGWLFDLVSFFITKYLKCWAILHIKVYVLILTKNGLGYFFMNSSGHPVHPITTDQTSKVLCLNSFWGSAKADSFSHLSLLEKHTIRLLARIIQAPPDLALIPTKHGVFWKVGIPHHRLAIHRET
jgi:hypothetical protein